MFEQVLEIVNTGISAAKADLIINNNVSVKGDILLMNDTKIDLTTLENIYVFGAGKASSLMASALEKILKERITSGLVITKYAHKTPCERIEVLEADHPVPNENNIDASQKLLDIFMKANKNDLVIFLFSGGGSALFEKLPKEIPLEELQQMNKLLLNSGANISEVNCVRRHVSEIKGGKLLNFNKQTKIVSLIISDVIGDGLEDICSGPTAPDQTSYEDVFKILIKYELAKCFPPFILAYINKGLKGINPETLKEDDRIFDNVDNFILGNNCLVLEAAEKKARSLGFETKIISDSLQGEARLVGEMLATQLKELEKSDKGLSRCLIAGGETTVNYIGKGKGGRNQELSLAVLNKLKDFDVEYLFASVATDGTDNVSDVAGAFASPKIWKRAQVKHLSPSKYLHDNNSYNFFRETEGLIKIGPTGTNVMDLMVALI